jgi:hypothetical protein
MARGIHRKATFEDRFYRNYCCGKTNHPNGWHKDKKIGRKGLRRSLKKDLEERIEEEEYVDKDE